MQNQKDKRKKENPNIRFLQNLKLLCTKCGRTKELINNFMKTKATSKAKKCKTKNRAHVLLKLETHC
jgi:hypothetical protein